MNIQPGMIGVNTADDNVELLIVVRTGGEYLLCQILDLGPEFKQYVPAADFWPLISKLNIGE